MDLGTVIGLIWGTTVFAVAIILGGAGFGAYYDLPSVFIVFGGLMAVTMVKWPISTTIAMFRATLKAVFFKPQSYSTTIDQMIGLAEKARRESIFALEKAEIADPFIKKACNLAADNRPPEVISSILQMDLESTEERHKAIQVILGTISEDAPAMGMIGTLVGLVAMLQNLSDPSAIGPGMAVAILTTFYGAMIANIYVVPIQKKLEVRSNEEKKNVVIVITAILGIVAGENPRLIREKLESFLPPSERKKEGTEEEATKKV
jgi:chemotaxis protein MotA